MAAYGWASANAKEDETGQGGGSPVTGLTHSAQGLRKTLRAGGDYALHRSDAGRGGRGLY